MEVFVKKRLTVQRVRGESNFWTEPVVSYAGTREESKPQESVFRRLDSQLPLSYNNCQLIHATGLGQAQYIYTFT